MDLQAFEKMLQGATVVDLSLIHISFLLKAAESIAHRRAACAKALAKGILIQLTSRRVLTVDDGMLYGVVDLLL